jgi:hypothetical protein
MPAVCVSAPNGYAPAAVADLFKSRQTFWIQFFQIRCLRLVDACVPLLIGFFFFFFFFFFAAQDCAMLTLVDGVY